MIRQYTVGIPGIGMKFDAEDVHSFVRKWYQKSQVAVEKATVVAMLGVCTVLEVVANNTADAHDYLYTKVNNWKGEVQ